jgi:hypothetical protein
MGTTGAPPPPDPTFPSSLSPFDSPFDDDGGLDAGAGFGGLSPVSCSVPDAAPDDDGSGGGPSGSGGADPDG